MSRRESRSSLGSRQSDALLEFETFKKKFLLANKHITKLNSTLSVRIEELNAQISTLYVENLRLRASEIALAAQLKREREKSQKVMADAEAASQALVKQLSYLRTTYSISSVCESPPTPPSPRARRPITNPNATSPTSPQFPRISRPPNIPGIDEEDENELSSNDETRKVPTPTKKKPKSKSSTSSRLASSKLPLPARPMSPVISTSYHEPSTPSLSHVDLAAVSSQSASKRKPSRRVSGLLSVTTATDALSVPRSASPAFGSPIRLEAGRLEEEEESAAVQGHMEIDENEPIVVSDYSSTKDRERRKPKKEARDASQTGSGAGGGREDVNSEQKPRSRKRDRPYEDETQGTEGAKTQAKEPSSRTALKPIDSNVRESLDHESKSPTTPRQFLVPTAPLPPLPTLSARSSSPAPPTSDGEGLGTRERRTRKSVNYTEPKLNTKMRKPDGYEVPKRKRSSAAAVMSANSYKAAIAASAVLSDGTTGTDAQDGGDSTDARSSVELQMNGSSYPLRGSKGNYIDPDLFPTPSTRPGSAAAMYSPGPPTRTTGSTASSSSSTTSLASNAPSTTSQSLKRKKSNRAQTPLSDDESDGADADAEFALGASAAAGSTTSSALASSATRDFDWSNVETSRRKALPKRSAAAAAAAALEDIRRHSMIV